jgi:hypothetical protein
VVTPKGLRGSRILYRIEARTGRVVRLRRLGCDARVAEAARVVWIADLCNHRVYGIDSHSGLVRIRRLTVPQLPAALTFAGGALWLVTSRVCGLSPAGGGHSDRADRVNSSHEMRRDRSVRGGWQAGLGSGARPLSRLEVTQPEVTLPSNRLGCAHEMQVWEVAVALGEVEAIADEELVRHGEADVAHGEVVDEPAVRAVEEGHHRDRRRAAEAERPHEVVERQAGVDDVLDDKHVPAGDTDVEVLQEAHRGMPAHRRAAVAGQLHEFQLVVDPERTREIGDKDDARLQRRDEERLASLVVTRDVAAELGDASGDLGSREVDLPDRVAVGLEAAG